MARFLPIHYNFLNSIYFTNFLDIPWNIFNFGSMSISGWFLKKCPLWRKSIKRSISSFLAHVHNTKSICFHTIVLHGTAVVSHCPRLLFHCLYLFSQAICNGRQNCWNSCKEHLILNTHYFSMRSSSQCIPSPKNDCMTLTLSINISCCPEDSSEVLPINHKCQCKLNLSASKLMVRTGRT